MEQDQARALIERGETLTVEFKSERRERYSDNGIVENVTCLANGEGGTLFLGVEDDGRVTGAALRHSGGTDPQRMRALIANQTVPPLPCEVTVLEIDGHEVIAIEVEKALNPVGTARATYRRRSLGPDGRPQCVAYPLHEMLSRTTSTGQNDYAALRVPGISWDDLDPAAFALARTLVSSSGDTALGTLDDLDLARALGVVTVGDPGPMPLMGALLLFGRTESLRRLAPTHEVLFQVLSQTSVTLNETVPGGLISAADQIHRLFLPYNTEDEVDAGMLRVALPKVPIEAFREAVANALVHRDFTQLGPVQVQITDDGVTIASPGGFPEGIRLDNLLVESRPRSRLLAEAFRRMGLVERTGRGIQRMYSGMLRIGRDAPDYTGSTSASVRVTFPTADADTELARYVFERERETGRPWPLQDLQVLRALRRDGALSLTDAATLTQRSQAEVRATLSRMVDSGVVEARGSGRGRAYHLSGAAYRAIGAASGYIRTRSFDPIQQQEMVLQYVRAHGSINRAQAAELCSIAPTQATTLLRRLVAHGRLELRGERRGAHYVLSRADEA
ncbi:RNA-binding domain-containing protein [Myceligenerans xiligouense]|uniref:ATP-dependent DNA helicase RecG n=1 Tax=Myceligenerans xiligouense TaxID=253184 RepID=A0A3N4YKV7_9MICO|nr:RNA-binding domain-containing protein [Myceligenerans xiligouense]RPF19944.1 ATP-dependent DNA helicase RecG [Myceligenerans xiligouense]